VFTFVPCFIAFSFRCPFFNNISSCPSSKSY
jgi:hypothetical protein